MNPETHLKTEKIKENQEKTGLNPEQDRAVRAHPERPLLIVAGAGTGKTRTLTRRVAHLIYEGVPAERICAITFTNKAARQMEEGIAKSLELRAQSKKEGYTRSSLFALRSSPFIGTFHALGARILRRNAALLGRTPDFVIFDDHDSFAVVKRALKDLDIKKESPAALGTKISGIKSGGKLEDAAPLVQEMYARYEASLESQNAFDFDDLLEKPVLLFERYPAVLKKYRAQFTHILIDEYQDLNDMQYRLVRLLMGERGSISVVGDAEQTIYGWRGSNIEIFLRFPDDWAEAEMVTLTQNYRSTQNILRAASGVISKNEYKTRVERATGLWTENVEGARVLAVETLNEDAEAAWIAEQVQKFGSLEVWKFASPETSKLKNFPTSKLEPPTTAILYRTNAQSRAIEQAFLRRRIPYIVYGGLKFYERREIKDIVAALRFSLNPKDEVARERLEKAFSKRRAREIADAFSKEQAAEPLRRIELFLKAADYMDYVEKNMTNPRDRRENIEELIHFAASYRDLAKFLEEIALLQATDTPVESVEREADGVTGSRLQPATCNLKPVLLMTMHLAKGLEFDRVFVAGVSEGLLPHGRSMGSEEEIQEERRLMYVGMTRARQELFLSFYGIPSRFLGEVPEDAVEFRSMLTHDGSLKLDDDYEERYISLD